MYMDDGMKHEDAATIFLNLSHSSNSYMKHIENYFGTSLVCHMKHPTKESMGQVDPKQRKQKTMLGVHILGNLLPITFNNLLAHERAHIHVEMGSQH
ncbi:hypothetical protein VIGAN_09045500 [Vigna angularis var. angularis]|uniref:Uncharacterized protein n=1 Tax=Vigna angularis var. angularis TaxID=157739 RepID=A0A0S3SWG0_PHAAN|nr:hypothetical protein VIGAN_09045500 [Vigna angularis var. angularis]